MDTTQFKHYLDDKGKPITISPVVAKDILAYMQAVFQRGDGKGNSDWKDNLMYCVVPIEYQLYLGDVQSMAGWSIFTLQGVQPEKPGEYYVLFGKVGEQPSGAVKVFIPLAVDNEVVYA